MLIGRAATDPEGQAYVTAIQEALQQLGWTLGRNIEIEIHWLPKDAQEEQVATRDILARGPDMLVVNGSSFLRATSAVAGSIPIVFVAIADPVGQGFVPNLAQPGGNLTGFAVEDASMGGKWLELLKEIAPGVTRCTAMYNPMTAANAAMFLSPMQSTARVLQIEQHHSAVHGDNEIEGAIEEAAREPRGGLIVLPDNFLYAHRKSIVALAERHALPAIYYHRGFAEVGGLVAYAIERVDLFRRAATYVDRILRGAKPAELPVQMPTSFELVINAKTAKALGLAIPPTLLARADEVIE
jgi:putative ABC transport system substrate-binding protein